MVRTLLLCATIFAHRWIGCVIVPDALQQACCAEFGSVPVNANGSFGCPFNANFTDVDLNTTYARVRTSCLETHNVPNSAFLCNDLRFGDENATNSGSGGTDRNSAPSSHRILGGWGIMVTGALFCLGLAGTISGAM